MLLLLVGAVLVVIGVGCWSPAAALICGGVLTMLGAVALAAVQDAAPPRPRGGPVSPNGVAPEQRAAVE